MTRLFLGIDGGGSGCRARIRTEAGEKLGEGEGGSANIYQDYDGSLRSIAEAAAAAIRNAGLPAGAAGQLHAGLGLAGAETLQDLARVEAQLPFARVTVLNDAPAACLGAHGGEDGGIVIAGTGSAGCAIVGGKTTIIGGRGFELGDGGSGAIMGRSAVRAAVLTLDGMGLDTPLTHAVLSRLGRDRKGLSTWAQAAQPGDYAKFAPDIFAFARQGDPVAKRILAKAVESVAEIADKLVQLGAKRVSLVGGMAQAFARDATDLMAKFVPAKADARDGAIMSARAAAGLAMVPQ